MRAVDLLGGTEILPDGDCLELLRGESVGRVGVIVDDQVEIFPVNYQMDGESIVFRTNSGRKMHGVLAGPATFEVDRIDLGAHTGWSVVVHGHSEGVTSSDVIGPETSAEGPWTGPKGLCVNKVSGQGGCGAML